MKKIILFSFISFYISHYISQENLSYQSPPKEILALANAQPAPSVLIDDKGKNILLRFRDSYSSIANLSETEVRLAGLRINPITNISSRQYYYTNLKLQKSSSKEIKPINGLPENPRLSNFSWSADQTKIAFTNTSKNGVELWFLDVRKENAVQLTEGVLNESDLDQILIYPNPTSDILNVELDGSNLISIYDITGRVIIRTLIQDKGMIDVNSLQKGTYLIKSIGDYPFITARRFTVN